MRTCRTSLSLPTLREISMSSRSSASPSTTPLPHSTIVTESSTDASRSRSSTSSSPATRYASACTNDGPSAAAGAPARSRTSATSRSPRTSRPAPIPWASVVFPAPSGPSSTTRSPARRMRAKRPPNACIVVRRRHLDLDGHCAPRQLRHEGQIVIQRSPRHALGTEPDRGRRVVRRHDPATFDVVRPAAQLTNLGGLSEEPARRRPPHRTDHRGLTRAICAARNRRQFATSMFAGARLPGGRHFRRSRRQRWHAACRPRQARGRARRRRDPQMASPFRLRSHLAPRRQVIRRLG